MEDNIRNNYPEPSEETIEIDVPKGQTAIRLDQFLTKEIKGATRTKIQNAIDAGKVFVNNKPAKASKKVQPFDVIKCGLLRYPPLELVPEDIPLEIEFEDEELMVVNKEPGMCSHPGVGNRYGTLINAVLWHLGVREAQKIEIDDDEKEEMKFLSEGVRPGLAHRLDKDTSGLLIISKNPENMPFLQSQFSTRSISREYHTLVWGKLKETSGTIEGNIGRSPRDRKKFVVLRNGGKVAITDYEVIEEFPIASYVKVKLRTGRTHQIRVHFGSIGHLVIGDHFYNGDKSPKTTSKFKRDLSNRVAAMANRQMLHAKKLELIHPLGQRSLEVDSTLPKDFQDILEVLRHYTKIFNQNLLS
ncbi:RluA family pseudouridine synthase [Candidatus Kapabacteria bacterium]|nr:RluA family pseudouridine synthase [Candidatus Kapabacteria bacterium]